MTKYKNPVPDPEGVSWCCGNYCWLAFVLWCGYCSVSFQSFVLRHWCPQHQETTDPDLEIRGGAGRRLSRLLERGGARSPKKFILALRASFWSNKGPLLDPPMKLYVALASLCRKICV